MHAKLEVTQTRAGWRARVVRGKAVVLEGPVRPTRDAAIRWFCGAASSILEVVTWATAEGEAAA
jgi:hypothetical protein